MLNLVPVVGESFGVTDAGRLSWSVASYSLTAGTFILSSGRLGDTFGYKKMLLIGFSWFSVWSLVVGLSVYSNYTLFLCARSLQGIGPAITLPNAIAIIGSTYPPGQKQGMIFALFGAAAPWGAILGQVFGALFSLAWWPWAFYTFSIVLAVLAIVGSVAIPAPPRKIAPEAPITGKFAELDLLGAATSVTALVLFNFAWNQASIDGWSAPAPIATLVLGVFLFIAFIFIELRVATNPLLPLYVLRSYVPAFVLGATALGWSCFGIWSFYMYQIIQVLRGASPLLAAAYFVPVIPMSTVAGLLTGALLGPAHVSPAAIMVFAMVAFVVGTVLHTFAPVDQTYWGQLFVGMLVIAFGMDMSFPAATITLSMAVPPEHQGIAASLVATVVSYSISISLGIAGTVYVHTNNGGQDIYAGYKAALCLAIGLASAGLLLALVFFGKTRLGARMGARNRAGVSESVA
jgi:MFS family permease